MASIANMSITASIMIVAVLILRLCLTRAPKILTYCLWGVVLFRLLCPVSFQADFSPLVFAPTTTQHTMEYIPVASRPVSPTPTLQKAGLMESPKPVAQAYLPVVPPTAPNAKAPAPSLSIDWTVLLWSMGVIVMAVYGILSYNRLRKKLEGSLLISPGIYLSDYIDIPFVIGLRYPKIYLPSDVTEAEKTYILAHEKHHIYRLDHITRFLAFVALALHWFNPLVWLAFYLSNKDMELSCDEAVMAKMEQDIRVDYATSLLRFATAKPAFTAIGFGESETKTRIKNVLSYKKPSFWILIVGVLAVATVSMILLANPKAVVPVLEEAPSIPTNKTNALSIGELFPQYTAPDTIYHNETFGFDLSMPGWGVNALDFVEDEHGVSIIYLPAVDDTWGGKIGYIRWVTDTAAYLQHDDVFRNNARPLVATADGVFYLEISGLADYDPVQYGTRVTSISTALGLWSSEPVITVPNSFAEIPIDAQVPDFPIPTYDISQIGYNPDRLEANITTFYVNRDGELYGWGSDKFGKFYGTTERTYLPTRITTKVKAVASTLFRIYYIDENDTLLGWNYQQNASRVILENVASVKCSQGEYIALLKNGCAYWGSDRDDPQLLGRGVVQICATDNMLAYVTLDGLAFDRGMWAVGDDYPFHDYPILIAWDIQEIASTGDGLQGLTKDGKAVDISPDHTGFQVLGENVAHLCPGGHIKTDGSFWGYTSDGTICLSPAAVNGSFLGGSGFLETPDGELVAIDDASQIQEKKFPLCESNNPYFQMEPFGLCTRDDLDQCPTWIEFPEVGYDVLVLTPKSTMSNIEFFAVSTDSYPETKGEILHQLPSLTSEDAIVVEWYFPGSFPHRGISFTNESGEEIAYTLRASGDDGTLYLEEMPE